MSQFPAPIVFVINLDSRPDRWESIRTQCLKCGINPVRISAVKASPGWHGCAYSHIKVAKKAKEQKLPWYVVLEDDASFSQENWRYFISLLPYLWKHKNNWDIFSGGTSSPQNLSLISKNPVIYRLIGWCTQFCLINISAYDTIIDWSPETKLPIDAYMHSLRIISTYPYIAYQIESQSDIENTNGPSNIIIDGESSIKKWLIEQNII